MRLPVSAAAAALLASSLVLGACGSQPKLEVSSSASPAPVSVPAAAPQQAAAPAAAPVEQTAPPIAADATLPPNHLPVAPPIAPGTAMPANHPPVEGMAGMQAAHGGAAGAPADPMHAIAGMVSQGGQGEQAVAWTAPKSWISEPPANAMRRAQYRVPGAGGDAECVVFYFGPGQGGDPQSNAVRWASQFANADGTPATSAMKTRTTDVGGMKVLYVETKGTYLAGTMAGTEVEKKPGYALLGAVVEGPDANWFVKLTGPEATVGAQRGAFESMIGSMKRGS